MKTIVISIQNCNIAFTTNILNWPKKYEDGMYYKTEHGMIPVAYCFKPDSKDIIEKCLTDINRMRKRAMEYEHDILTKTMRQHRRDQ